MASFMSASELNGPYQTVLCNKCGAETLSSIDDSDSDQICNDCDQAVKEAMHAIRDMALSGGGIYGPK